MNSTLIKLDRARQALKEVRSIDEAKAIRDKAAALRHYAKQQGYGLEIQNDVAEIKLRAERRAGELLAEMGRAQGVRADLTSVQNETKLPFEKQIADLGITKTQSHRWQAEASVQEEHFEQYVVETKAAKEEVTSAGLLRLARGQPVHFSSGTSEWFTPPQIIERVLEVWNEIDLDPCSNSHTAPNIPARQHFTKEDDGLSRRWWGHVYMNPPYGREIAEWVEHLCQQFECGNVAEAIALVPARTDTGWFRRFKEYPRCFVWGRLRFSESDTGAPFPSMVVYLGTQRAKFVEIFGDIGDVYSWIDK